MPIVIHGKKYFTVAERLKEAQKSTFLASITTEFLPHETKVICRATVTLLDTDRKPTKIFQGTSAADPSKSIERTSPYEVAETSAVGRALAFAGFKVTDDIASADEMQKAEAENTPASMFDILQALKKVQELFALEHDAEMKEKLSAAIKGLEQAKEGKRELTKVYVRDIIDRANIKIQEKLLEIEKENA